MKERLEFVVLLTAAGRVTDVRRDARYMGLCYRVGFGRRRWVLHHVCVSKPPAPGVFMKAVAVPQQVAARGDCVFQGQARLALSQAALRTRATPRRKVIR